MPDLTIVVAGTHTEVGKTWVACALLSGLRSREIPVAARKPVQSFAPTDSVTDADQLAVASREHTLRVCPKHRRYELPWAPPMAAARLDRPPFKIGDLVAELELPEHGVAIIEGVGGVRSPLAFDGDTADLAEAVDADVVVLVAESGLGVINAVLTSIPPFGGRRVVVYLNRFDPNDELHVANRAWLKQYGVELVTNLQDWYQESHPRRPDRTQDTEAG